MPKKRVLAILSSLLGNKTLSDRYLEVLKDMEDCEVSFFYINGEDYNRYPARRLGRFSSALRLADIAKRKFEDCNPDKYDLLFINGYEIAYGLLDQVKVYPTVLALDAVPSLVHELLICTSKGWLKKVRSYLAARVMAKNFKKLFAEVEVFLPMTDWCGQAVKHDYGICEDKIFVTYGPADLEKWCPDHKGHGEELRMLFVGNDFKRKGGDFLLNMFQHYFQEKGVELVIVSNDPELSKENMPKGVSLFQNIPHEKILHIFKSVDLFVFPTRKEYLGIVATEACCVGLPVVARDVGGLGEFVIDDYNGYLMPYDSSEEEWVEKIQYLIDNPQERKRMGENSRKIAEEMFNMQRFEKIINHAFMEITL